MSPRRDLGLSLPPEGTAGVPHYPVPWQRAAAILLAAMTSRNVRSFRDDAQAFLTRLRPALCIYGQEHIPGAGPVLLTVNHYTRPGFQAWWLALAISAVVPVHVHWMMTAAWTYADPLRSRLLTPLTRWLFARIARLYGFTAMPPMPPDPADLTARALAVRRVLACARSGPQPVIALAPEGADAADGVLHWPPPGSGRLLLRLGQLGLRFVPVGAFESGGAFCLRFGPGYSLPGPAAADRDRHASWIVMCHIAAQLPPGLRGAWAACKPEEDEL